MVRVGKSWETLEKYVRSDLATDSKRTSERIENVLKNR